MSKQSDLVNITQNGAIPAGTIAFLGVSSAPTGWLKANGAAVSRTTYAALYAEIGTAFGSGDGSTTFNLPDLRGEFPRGLDDGRGVDSGRSIGTSQSHAYAAHSHSLRYSSVSEGNDYGSGGAWLVGRSSGLNRLNPPPESYQREGTHITSSGDSETRPRNIALLACIKY